MLASLRRIYLYAVASAALLFLVGVLQNFLFQVSASAGARIYDYESASGADFSRALAFLLVALAIVLPVGVLHWWFIRRDAVSDLAARAGIVRVLFIDLLTILLGTVTVASAASLAYAVAYNTNANSDYYGYAPSVAGPLAATLAWGAALVLVVLERRATPPLTGTPRTLSLVLGYLTQIGLLIALITVGARAVQAVLEDNIQALPRCGPGSFGDGCQYAPSVLPIGWVVQAVVLFAGLLGFTLWTRRDGGSVLRLLADSAFIIIATTAAITGLDIAVDLLLNLATNHGATLPLSLVSNAQGPSYPFAGPLVLGGGALAFYFIRAWRTPAQGAHPQAARQVAVVGVALPLAFAFLYGIAFLLADLFRALQGAGGLGSDPLAPWALIIAGAGWLALWPTLARMSDPRGNGPLVPRRAYVYILFASSVVAGVIALAVGVYSLVTGAIGAPADPDGQGSATAFAIFLVSAATAGYYLFVLTRDNRVLRAHAPAPVAAVPAPATPDLESVLQSLTTGQLTVPQAAAILREQFGAR
jgi:hypothetical protein